MKQVARSPSRRITRPRNSRSRKTKRPKRATKACAQRRQPLCSCARHRPAQCSFPQRTDDRAVDHVSSPGQHAASQRKRRARAALSAKCIAIHQRQLLDSYRVGALRNIFARCVNFGPEIARPNPPRCAASVRTPWVRPVRHETIASRHALRHRSKPHLQHHAPQKPRHGADPADDRPAQRSRASGARLLHVPNHLCRQPASSVAQ